MKKFLYNLFLATIGAVLIAWPFIVYFWKM